MKMQTDLQVQSSGIVYFELVLFDEHVQCVSHCIVLGFHGDAAIHRYFDQETRVAVVATLWQLHVLGGINKSDSAHCDTCYRLSVCIYEGRSINKLQNGIILSILRMFIIWKIRNMRFVGNIIVSTKYDFYFDDVTVTSFIGIKCGDVTIQSIP